MKKLTALLLLLVFLLSVAGCAADSAGETVTFQGRVFQSADLSEATLQWLEHYNSLTEEEQLAISYIPADLYQLLGYGTGEDIPAETE